MKIRQLCLAMLATATMWSCAKDDVVKDESGILDNGMKAVSISIVNPTTKAAQDAASSTVTIQNITLKLNGTFTGTAPNGETEGPGYRFKTFTSEADAEAFVFFGVNTDRKAHV